MTTSGTYNFSLTIADVIDEAFERCGMDPAFLTHRHLVSARRSIDLMFKHWITKGIRRWEIGQQTTTLTTSVINYNLPVGAIDVISMVLRRNDIDVPMMRISQDDYFALSKKDLTGRPDRFFVNRSATAPFITLWNAPENSTDQIIYYYMLYIQDAGNMTNTPDIPPHWFEAMCADTAQRLAVKWAPDRLGMLAPLAADAFMNAVSEDRDKAPTIFRVSYNRRNRT